MLRLFCHLIGWCNACSLVEIDLCHTVADFKFQLKKMKSDEIGFDADLLQVFLARENGAWLREGDVDMRSLQTGKFTARIKRLLQEDKQLEMTWRLDCDDYLGLNFAGARCVHVRDMRVHRRSLEDVAVDMYLARSIVRERAAAPRHGCQQQQQIEGGS